MDDQLNHNKISPIIEVQYGDYQILSKTIDVANLYLTSPEGRTANSVDHY